MKTLVDPNRALSTGLAAIRRDYQVPADFPPEVTDAARAAVARPLSDHVDRTGLRFVTLDPASSTDLDQAFTIEPAGRDLLLRYAIADVASFVADNGLIDAEAWRRGETIYLPDGKATLYPPLLSEQAASLLPDGDRPAVIFEVRIDPAGTATLEGAERAIIRSVAKLAYEAVTGADLPPGFAELARRISAAEDARGAARVDPPEQELARGDDGRLHLAFRPRLQSEDDNAALSLATNLAVAAAMRAHHCGLFRVMAPPDGNAVERLRHTARLYGFDWPGEATLEQFSRTLDANDPRHAAMMLAIRRAGDGARYAPYQPGVTPWHAAMAATYAQATAPLRRLADRYVVQAALALANGKPLPDPVAQAFQRLPAVMAKADARAGQIDRAVIDLAEAVLLSGREGETFTATVLDADDGAGHVQLADLPVIVRIKSGGLIPGERLDVQLLATDVVHRTTQFVPLGRESR